MNIKSTLLIINLLSLPVLTHAQGWILKTGLPGSNSRHHPVTWSINGYGYAVTGTTEAQAITNDFFQYDPTTDTWVQLNDFPGQARSFAIGMAYQGKGYLGFGSSTTAYLNDLWSYDPQTGVWDQLATCPCLGRQHPAFAVNEQYGKIYVGLGNSSFNLRDWWEYDIATDAWTQKSYFPGTPRHHPFQFSLNGYTYAGFGDDHGTTYAREDFYKYDPATNTWTKVADAPDGIGRIAGAQFKYGGSGYVLDGDGAYHRATFPSIFWQYDVATDQWLVLTPHPGVSLWAPGAFVINGIVYLIGGVDRYGPTNVFFDDMWTFNIAKMLSVRDISTNKFTVNVYPNPVQSHLHVETQPPAGTNHFKIYNLMGQVVLKQESRSDNVSLNVARLADGVYLLKIVSTNGKRRSMKFIKD